MVDLKYQKRMAAEVMKCGIQRVYLDPNKTEDISEAVTRTDIKSLIKNKVIIKKKKKGVSRGRARYIARQKKKGKRKGPGSRKGAKYARFPKKRRWIQTIRPLRRKLKEYREGDYIDRATYRKFYLQAKGGMFRNIAHLETHMKMEKVFKKPIPKHTKEAKK
jgi:large subunit ribosomal protein L19e